MMIRSGEHPATNRAVGEEEEARERHHRQLYPLPIATGDSSRACRLLIAVVDNAH